MSKSHSRLPLKLNDLSCLRILDIRELRNAEDVELEEEEDLIVIRKDDAES